MINGNGKTIAGVINEAKDELKDFFETRLQMFAGEMKQKISVWSVALPMFLVAGVMGFLGFILLSFALVAAVAHAIGWGWAALVVGVFYSMTAGLVGYLAYREIKEEGVAPVRTLHVLKMDKIWLENEARTQI